MMANQLPTGVVNIRGKQYETVALRVHKFREHFPALSLVTDVLHRDDICVVMKATISDEGGRVLATGHAEEYRKASEINRTSALENAETSAIGRALAALGLGGTEFASADEVARAVSGDKPSFRSSATMGEFESLPPGEQQHITELALEIVALVAEDQAEEAWRRVESEHLDDSQKTALWSRLDSKTRASIKRAGQALKVAA
jgi:hypothetical protein